MRVLRGILVKSGNKSGNKNAVNSFAAIESQRTTHALSELGAGRAGKTVGVCAAVLAAGTVLLPATPALASVSGEYEYNFRDVFTGAYEQTIPFEANVSATNVSGVGETLDFRFSLRADEWKPGWLYPLDAFKLTLDLTNLADDVVDIEAVLDSLDFTPMRNLEMEVIGNSVEFYGEFDPDAIRQFEVKFSVEVASGGDGLLDLPARFETRGVDEFNGDRWDYGPAGGTTLPVVVAHPAPIVAKSADRVLVTPSAPDVKYTITVKRPEGIDVPEYFLIEEDLTDVIQEADGLVPASFVVERGLGDLRVDGHTLLGTGTYDENGEWVLSFVTPHLGGGDAVLTNTVCVHSPERSVLAQQDPNVPVTGHNSQANVVMVSVPGGSACGVSPEVSITKPPVEPDTEGPQGSHEIDPDPMTPQQVSPTEQLAATGSQSPAETARLGTLLAVAGAVLFGAARVVRRARVGK